MKAGSIEQREAEILGAPPRIPPLDRAAYEHKVRDVTRALRAGIVRDDRELPLEAIPEIMFTLCHHPDLWGKIMALSLQEGGISRHKVMEWVQEAYPFNGIDEDELHSLLFTMLSRQILYEADGLLSLGAKGEQLYGRRLAQQPGQCVLASFAALPGVPGGGQQG